MTPLAITFLVLSALLIWGGLVVSIVLLRRDVPEEEDGEAPAATDAPQRSQRPQPHRSPRANRSGRARRR